MSSGKMQKSKATKMSTVLLALLIAAALSLTLAVPAVACIGSHSSLQPSSTSAVANRTIQITGTIVNSGGWRVVSEFVIIAINEETNERTEKEHAEMGTFTITIQVPAFAGDNDSIEIRVLSPDEATIYGNTTLKLSDLNHTVSYSTVVTLETTPPNYNWLVLILMFVIFVCILAGYILFTKWLVIQAVLRRSNEIMIERSGGDVARDTAQGSDDEEDDEEDDEASSKEQP